MSLAAHPQALCGCSFSGEAAAFFSVITESPIVLSMFSSLPLVKISISVYTYPRIYRRSGGRYVHTRAVSCLEGGQGGSFLRHRKRTTLDPSGGIQRYCHRVPKALSAERRLIGSSLQVALSSQRQETTDNGRVTSVSWGGRHDIKALPFCGG